MAQLQDTFGLSGSDVATASLTGVTAGSALIVTISQSTSATRTYTVVDDVDGALTAAQLYNPNRGAHVYVIHDVTAGAHTVTVTASGASTFRIALIEWGGLDALATPATGTYDDGADATTHYADAVGVTTTEGAAIVVVGALNSGTGVSGLNPGNDYTEIALSGSGTGAAGLTAFTQVLDSGLPITNERGTWTTTGTPRRAVSTIVAFPYEANDPAPTAASGGFVTWFGR